MGRRCFPLSPMLLAEFFSLARLAVFRAGKQVSVHDRLSEVPLFCVHALNLRQGQRLLRSRALIHWR